MKNIYAVLGLLILVGFSSVQGQTYSPTQGGVGVSISPTITITFSQTVTLGNNKNIYVAKSDWSEYITLTTGKSAPPPPAIPTDSRLDATGTVLTIDLSGESLTPGTEYLVFTDTDAILVGGVGWNSLTDDSFYRFTTETADPVFSPERDAIGVSSSPLITLTLPGTVTLGEGVNIYVAKSDWSSFYTLATGRTTPPISTDSRLSVSGSDLIIDFTGETLDSSTEYLVYSDAGAILLNGSAWDVLTDDAYWHFTTAAPLEISSYSPAQNATNVALNQDLVLTFNQDIQWTGNDGDIYIWEQGSGERYITYYQSPTTPNGNVVPSGNTFTIYLTKNFLESSSYYVTIPNNMLEAVSGEDFVGINNGVDNNWRFTTVGPPTWATGYPLTQNLSPTNVDIVGQTDKDGTYCYIVTTNSNTPSVAQIKGGVDQNGDAAMYENSAAPGTMTADVEFSESLDITGIDSSPTTYYVFFVTTSDSGLDSEIGATSFTTVERDAPVVESTNPLDGATDISISSDIVITYDEPIRNLDGSVIDDTNVADLISIPGFINFNATINASKDIITVSPITPFDGNTTYTVVLGLVEDYLGNEQVAPVYSFSFTTSSYITWDGSASSDWNDDDNWSAPYSSGLNVIIPSSGVGSMPVITSSLSENVVGDIVIEAGASLEISSSGSLTVTGAFVMESSYSDPGNASLINEGTLSIIVPSNVQIQQNASSSPAKWYYISSPVSGASENTMNVSGGIQLWDTPTGLFSQIGSGVTLTAARGYRSWSSTDMVFSGAINDAGSYAYDANQSSSNPYGWELVGNPYPCSIDWSGIGTTGLLDAFWIWINDQSIYGTYNGNALLGTNLSPISPAVIPSNQAFWVRVDNDATMGTVTIPSSARTHNTTTYLKSSNKVDQGVVRLVAINGDKKDELVFGFNADAKDTFDSYDSKKRFAADYANYFEIYSLNNGEKLTIDSYSALNGVARAIPLGVKVPAEGEYVVSLSELENIPSDYTVKIEDKEAVDESDRYVDLQAEDLKFTSSAGSFNERFVLHIVPGVTTDIDVVDENNIKIYAAENVIYMDVNNLTEPIYQLYSLSGQLLEQGQLNSNALNSVNTNYKGVVVVKVSSEESVISEKVFVK
ncbi:Ig-like domain-containing protein [Carboxylicivirga sp. A043]|uniref:Ig-like domain-containing protein n=1 Tax=Carboxylicivirga litoralis TaxID=2816963 RepID=UPI0021CB900F|nr:Ig-like domain-containing protein [Carboxylicivirga sp. A043]MCU4156038.1 Ig-like domain-containing protein [Carboxylicivirga sp. A043]